MVKEYKIGDFLKRVKNAVEIKDGVLYKRVTIKTNHQGVIMRDQADGSVIGTKNQFIVNGGDFILSKIDARYGAFGIIPEVLDGAIITGNFWTYKVDTDIVDTEWFFYFTHSYNFIQICKESSTGTTHRKYLDEKTFLSHKLTIPDKVEQVRMVERYLIGSKISRKCSEEITIQKKLLSQLKQSILQEAIQGKITANWRTQNPDIEPASELLSRIGAEKNKLVKQKKIKKEAQLSPITKAEIPYELPNGWIWLRLEDIASIGTGATPLTSNKAYYDGGNIPWVTSAATGELFVHKPELYITEKALKETNCRIYPKGTLVVAMYGQGKTRGQITELNFDAATNQACATITIHNESIHLRKFIKLYFRKIYLEIRELAQGGAQPNLNMGKIKSTIIPLAPLAELKAITEKVDALMEQCSSLEAEITQSEQHAQMLMQAVLKEAFKPKSESEEGIGEVNERILSIL